MKLTYKLFFLSISILFALFFSSCDEDSFSTVVDVELPDLSDRLVVNSIVNPEGKVIVGVFQSTGILELDNSKFIENATIELFEGGELVENNFELDSLSIIPNFEFSGPIQSLRYTSDFKVFPEKTYTLKVTAPDFESAEATVTVPKALTYAQVYISDSNYIHRGEGYEQELIELSIEFDDEAGQENFYYFMIAYSYPFYGSYFDENGNWIEEPDTILRRYYSYFLSPELFDSQGDEGLGVDPDQTNLSYYSEMNATMNDEFFDGNRKKILIYLDKNQFSSDELVDLDELEIIIGNMDRNFYFYKRSTNLQAFNRDNPFAEPVTVFNNIENGFGIFGAFNEKICKIE